MSEATGGIPVRDIVLRIKCELSDAFEDQNGAWLIEEGKFAWLRNWTAQVDLILQILDTATLSPGFSANQPFHNAYATRAGPSSISTAGVPGTSISSIPQSFAVAAGANIGGQAQRTETISFALSIKELNAWRKAPGTSELCALSDGMDLKGRVGLKEWLREALTPVASEGDPNLPEYLYAGVHPKPNATAPTAQNAQAPKTPAPIGGQTRAAALETLTCDPNPPPVGYLQDRLGALQAIVQTNPAGCAGQVNGNPGEPSPANLACDYANALSVTRTAQQSADTAAKDAAANFTSANSLYSSLNKTVGQYYKNNDGYKDVLDPSVIGEYESHISQWSKTSSKVSTLLSSIKQNADAAMIAQKEVKGGDAVIGVAKALNMISMEIGKLSTPPDPDKVKGICISLGKIQTTIESASNTAAKIQADADTAVNAGQNADRNTKTFTDYVNGLNSDISSAPNIDPPVSTIGQSIQFILTYGGGVTPTWTFARFSGPSNPLFSIADTRTHTLNITLGPAVPGTYNTPSQSVTQNQLYLLLNNLLPPTSR
jgi:hypothetical protein